MSTIETIRDLPEDLFVLAPTGGAGLREESDGPALDLAVAVYGGYEVILVWDSQSGAEAWLTGGTAEIGFPIELSRQSLHKAMLVHGFKAIVYNLEPGEGVKRMIPEERVVWRD